MSIMIVLAASPRNMTSLPIVTTSACLKNNGPKYLTTEVIDDFFTLANHFQTKAEALRNP